MIKIFDIKKKVNELNREDKDLLKKYNDISKSSEKEIFNNYSTRFEGLVDSEVNDRFSKNGPNIVVKDNKKSWIYFFALSFKDQFIIVLFVLAIINFFLGDKFGSLIIISIGILSALIRFFRNNFV